MGKLKKKRPTYSVYRECPRRCHLPRQTEVTVVVKETYGCFFPRLDFFNTSKNASNFKIACLKQGVVAKLRGGLCSAALPRHKNVTYHVTFNSKMLGTEV